MKFHFQQAATAQSNRCEICHCDLPFKPSLPKNTPSINVCQSIECQNILKQKPLMSKAAFDAYLQSHRKVIKERQERIDKEIRLKENNRMENNILFKAVESHCSKEQEISQHFVVLPLGIRKLVPLSAERKERYRVHLEKAINEALQYEKADQVPVDKHSPTYQDVINQDQEFSEFPELKDMSDQFCIKCKGGCCAAGEDRAYITAATIRRLLDLSPELEPDDLLQTYLSYLPEQSMAHSCINQVAMGCVLPRELRSATCNYFFCDAVVNVQKKARKEKELKPVVVIQRENTHWEKTKLTAPNKAVSVALVTPNECVDMDEFLEEL